VNSLAIIREITSAGHFDTRQLRLKKDVVLHEVKWRR